MLLIYIPTELQSDCHEYEKIPENSRLHNSDLEAKQDMKVTEFCPDSGIPLPYLENNEYIISVSIVYWDAWSWEYYQTCMVYRSPLWFLCRVHSYPYHPLVLMVWDREVTKVQQSYHNIGSKSPLVDYNYDHHHTFQP